MTAPDLALPLSSDFFRFEEILPEEDRALLARVRAFMREEVAPIINDHWRAETFPRQIIPGLASLGIGGLSFDGHGGAGRSVLLDGFVSMEIAAVDCSVATFHGVQCHLTMGAIHTCGSDAQKERWLPPLARYETLGAFALTEPEVGSGAARGLRTTARREGEGWVLDGAKRWIGNATFADVIVVWARDVADDQVKGFLVEAGSPGLTVTQMRDKTALRAVENADVVLEEVRVPEANRLEGARTFADTAAVLAATRALVAWEAVGCARGAYELALRYAGRREQFGRPIASFQLVQDLLVRMLGNVTASQALVTRLSQLQDAGEPISDQASLAKEYCTSRMRETVGWARELFAGNGILLEHDVGRFVADAEAIYSYEGTREINALVVGRAITGRSAFV